MHDHELHELNPTGRFSDRADDYRRYRPDYPAAAIDSVLRGLGDPASLTGADVGAGTGISALALAERGVRVIAVEPNAAMRAATQPHSRVEWRDGTAEATTLEGASVDFVLCAQAFHWFRAPEALAEFQRVLKPGGRLALMWNNRDRADPFTREFIAAIHAVNGESLVEQRAFDPAVIAASGRFDEPHVEEFPHSQTLDLAGVIGRATSASYVAKEGPELERLKTLLAEAYERHRDANGHVTLRYRTHVYLSPESASPAAGSASSRASPG
jgi:SAM-dependent methyltransferase